MIKEIIKALFGSAGKIILDIIFFYLFYLSSGWFGYTKMEGDSQGWGALFYFINYVPLVVIIFLVYSFVSLREVGVAGKHIFLFMLAYSVIMIGVQILNLSYLGIVNISRAFAITTLVANLIFLGSLHFMKMKYGHI